MLGMLIGVILYVTERCVFKLTDEGLLLSEIAPGIDLEKDILSHMAFRPIIKKIKTMDEKIFMNMPMNVSLEENIK